ncbi:Rv0361 family membrane protein [Micromonospora haikouensis]|uniref:Rv0361 family membrane protein n=1 Tax=Micromonospora haikouensis TaxID=686309 RepID=UPI003D8CD20D
MTQPPNGGATGSPSGPPSGDHTPGPFGGPAGPGAGAIPPPPPGYPPYHAPVAPKQRRGVLVASIVAVLALLLCGGGGAAAFFTLRSTENGEGAKEPAVAVENFLTAVYKERDARKAAGYVCAAARDDRKITAKVTELKRYTEQYSDARFRWTSPKVDNQTGDRATVTTRVTMTTSDEKVADQDLRFTVVQKTGWWVCEIA